MQNEITDKYLKRYAEAEAALVAQNELPFIWNESIVLPVRREAQNVFKLIESLNLAAKFARKRVLLILVVNGTLAEAHENLNLIEALHKKYPHELRMGAQLEILTHAPVDILLVDRATEGFFFNEKQGVGLARKIGCDIALQLIEKGKVLSSWIRNIDADVIVPEDYFFNPEEHREQASAFLYDFIHDTRPLGALAPALEIYDALLRYYVEGLRWAGSPYAHHSLGSIITVRAEAYAAVRGFPKREAGEDFYLLNKLAKVGRIEENLGSPVRIEGRLSERVPFGTGVKVNEFGSLLAADKEILFYNPLVFVLLKSWLDVLNQYASSSDMSLLRSVLLEDPSNSDLKEALEALEWVDLIESLWAKSKTSQVRLKNFHDFFDAFRTLKFIHYLRDTKLPSIRWSKALEIFEEISGGSVYSRVI